MKLKNQSPNQATVLLRKRRGGAQAGILALIISAVALCLAFGLLAYNHFKPEVRAQGNESSWADVNASSSSNSSNLTEEQKQLIEAEQKRRKAEQEALLKEQEALNKQQRIERNVTEANKAVSERKWVVAEVLLEELTNDGYSLDKREILITSIIEGKLLEREDIVKVDEILQSVELLNNGEFSWEAIEKLDEALDIYPGYQPTLTLKRKINGYPYSIKVPEEVSTLREATKELREGDTLILGKGKHEISEVLNKGINIEGQGETLTTIQCLTQKGSALAMTGVDQIYTVSNLTIEGLSYEDDSLERYPLVSINAKVTMKNVVVKNGSGHGVAVTSGSLSMFKCKVSNNAWDGISIIGANSSAEITDSEISGNYEHGIDFWDGAKGELTNLKVTENIASGVVVMGQGTNVRLEQVQALRNRHCGILINDQAEASLDRVFSSDNQLSGIVIQNQGTKVKCGITVANNNLEAGFLIAPSAEIENFITATSEGNKGGNVIRAELKSLPSRTVKP